ncbi:hypothetical protein AMECASPLE_019667 [Ameca splendens]|uniref:Uncharacterized protein n=1 Tax=Ameca splendens TaxID=208324 RepID=A0ABV0Z2S0_9TELE
MKFHVGTLSEHVSNWFVRIIQSNLILIQLSLPQIPACQRLHLGQTGEKTRGEALSNSSRLNLPSADLRPSRLSNAHQQCLL